MNGPSFPKPVSQIVGGLTELFRHQGREEIVAVLENAHAFVDCIDTDNWNGGTYTWALRLQVPLPIFATIEARLTKIEHAISEKLSHFDREYSNDALAEVTITPMTNEGALLGQRLAPAETEVNRLWGDDSRFRLFVSHVSTHKVAVAALRNALELRGVKAFVAHNDIEPSRKWQDEIELALRSMHGLAALLTSDFHASKWTDQEIGWALGRGVLVLPVRAGTDPYGLIGKFQGLPGDLNKPKSLAAQIAMALLANQQSAPEMRRAVVSSFASASSSQMAMALCPLVSMIHDPTDGEKDQLWKACESNPCVASAEEVRRAVHAAVGAPHQPLSDEIPF